MGDRSWNYNNSHGDRRGGGNPRPRYVSRNTSYYVNHGPPGRYRPPEPRQHHHSYNYSGPPRNYLNHETEPRIVRTVINSSYQPPPPATHRYSRDSRDFNSADSRHHDDSGNTVLRQHEVSGSGPPVPRNWSSSEPSSRQRNESPSDRFHGNRSRSPSRSQMRRSPSNPRSPTRYMNRSPPRPVARTSPITTSRSSPHRSGSPSLSPRQRTGRWQNVSNHEEREKSEKRSHSASSSRNDSLDEPYTRRIRKESESDVDLTPEVLKLIERVMEYQAWLTGVKHNILASRRGTEREDEIEGIDWCLGVIRDIKSSVDVSIQTLNRAQEVILELVRKNAIPISGGSTQDRGIGSPSVLPTDDSESARSPSPGFSSSVAKRREPDLLSPRVIPTERTAFRSECNFNYDQTKDKPRDSELIDYHSDYASAQNRDAERVGPLYERRKRPSVEVMEVPNDAPLFERRPKPRVILQDKDMRTSTLTSATAQWEGSNPEVRGFERPQKAQDQDMRLLGPEHPALFNEYRSDHLAPEKPLSLPSDNPSQIVPSNSTDIPSSSNVSGPGLQSNLNSSLATAPLQPPPIPPQLPIPFLNQSMLNQFLNPSVIAGMSGMNPQQILAMQNQAQMVFGFQQQMTNQRPGLLPIPSVTNNISQNFVFQQSNNHGAQPTQSQPPTKPPMTERSSLNPSTNSEPTTEIMMSRIMAKAAQSFSNRGRGSSSRYGQSQQQYGRDKSGFNNSSSQGVVSWSSNEMNQGQSPHLPESANTIQDPRLKPRVPRQPVQLDQSETKSTDISTPTSTESTSHNPNHSTNYSRMQSPRDKLEQSPEKIGTPYNLEGSVSRHSYAAHHRKHEEEYRSSDQESRHKSYSDRRNSYGFSGRDRPYSGYERSHYDREMGTERDGNTGRNSRGNVSPRRRFDERNFSDRNATKSHPAVLPFEKSVFKNSSESGGSSSFKIPKKPNPTKQDDTPVPDIQQNIIDLDEDWDADLRQDQVRKAEEDAPILDATVHNSTDETQQVEQNSVVNTASPPLPVPDPSPTDSAGKKTKPLPREADNLIRSLLLESLNPEEAEILGTDDDYLSSAIAKLKAELSEKLRAKAKQKSSGPEIEQEDAAEPDTKTKSAPSASKEEAKTREESEEEEKSEELSRSRSRKRTQPSRKRKSSLDKLQAALQEMNFDAIMPTGPRNCKATPKNQVDDKPNEKAKQHPKTVQSSESEVIVETRASAQASDTTEVMLRGKPKKRKAATWYAVRKKGRKTTSQPVPKETPTNTDLEPSKKSKTVRVGRKIKPKKSTRRSKLFQQSNREGVVTRSRRSDAKVTDAKDVDKKTETLEASTDVESSKLEEGLNEDGLMELVLDDLNDGLNDELDFDMLLDEDATLPLHPEDFCIPDSDDENGFIISEDGLEGLTVAEPEKFPDFNSVAESNNESENMDTEVPQDSGMTAETDAEAEVVLSAHECHRCTYTGKKLIHHYANSHPDVSIPQARLGQLTYESLLRLNSSHSPQLMEIPIKTSAANKLVCACLYCQDVFHDLHQYVDHLTTHTGEYRYACNICGVRYPFKKTAFNHLKSHKKDISRRVEEVYDLTISTDGTEFYSYVCRECFYFQLHAAHISTHLEEIGHSEEDVICVKFQIQQPETSLAVPVEPPAPVLVRLPTYDPSVFLGTEQVILDDEIGTAARAVSPLTVMETCEDGQESNIDQIYDRLFGDYFDSSEISEASNKSGESDSKILDEAGRIMEQIVDRLSLADELNANFVTLSQNLQESVTNLYSGPETIVTSPDSNDAPEFDDAGECTDDDKESEELNDFYYDTSSSDEDSCDSMETPDIHFSESSMLMDISAEEPSETDGLKICSSSLHAELPRDITTNYIPPAALSPIEREIKLGRENEGINIKLDLEGIHLYRCAQEGCDYRATTGAQLKEHLPICGFLSDNQSNCCFHCEKRFKLPMSLIDHLKVHGKPKQVCSLCSFRCCAQGDLTKHMRCVHKVTGYKTIRSDRSIESDVIMYPKDATNKFTDAQCLQQNHMLYSPRVEFLPTEIANIPNSCIFSSPLHCALCSYSTKVRTNIIRHLKLHEDLQTNGEVYEVPSEAPVNPVPCLARKELMFDKMVNLAGSSYVVQSTSTLKEVEESSPRFVVDQFKYVCSVRNCKQITVDDSMLRAHMKALHSEVALYHCPHCHDNEKTRNDPRNAVPIEKLGVHLKLHGPRLLKCGHCPFIHFQTKVMEKHVAEKHFDRKPNHLVVRNLDDEGNVSNRRSSVDEQQKNNERWRCALCRSLLPSWNEARQHCQDVHKVPGQFVCNICKFSDDAIFQMSNHITSKECVVNISRIPYVMIMFARNEAGNQDETSVHNIWRRDTARVKHIRGIFLEESCEPVFDQRKSTPAVLTQKTTAASSSYTNNKKKVLKAIPASSKSMITNTSKFPMICPKCKTYKTTNKKDMTVHLHNELRYQRYVCKICGIKNVTLTSLKVHVENDHMETYVAETFLILKPKLRKIEKEVRDTLNFLEKDMLLKADQNHKPVVVASPKKPTTPTKKKLMSVTQNNIGSPSKGGVNQVLKPAVSPVKNLYVPELPHSYSDSDVEVIDISDEDEVKQHLKAPAKAYQKNQMARKSTSRGSTLLSRKKNQPVARKRVTQVPRNSLITAAETSPYSFYRRKLSSVDVHAVRLLTNVGDACTSVSVANLHALLDLSPFVPLADIMTD